MGIFEERSQIKIIDYPKPERRDFRKDPEMKKSVQQSLQLDSAIVTIFASRFAPDAKIAPMYASPVKRMFDGRLRRKDGMK
jgi:hypothetical protein